MWCFLLIACVFYAFYQTQQSGWAEAIMCTALTIWMMKPCLRIIEQIIDSVKGVETAVQQERKELLADDANEKDDQSLSTTTTTSEQEVNPKGSLWKRRVMPFFSNPWPMIFLIFGVSEIIWVLIPLVLPWYLSYVRVQVFMPVVLAAISSFLVFEYRFSRPGPPRESPAPM